MKNINHIWIIALILIVPTVYAGGSIWTGALSPSTANLCGSYTNNLTLTATNVWNSESVTLTDINATLIANSSGLTFLTNQIVNLGSINALSQSPIDPNWTIQCDESFPGSYLLYVNYTSSNGYNGSSLDQSISSVIAVFSSNDTTPPIITSHSPTGKITASSATLNVTTNENATCKYSTASGVNYDNMDGTFDTTGKTAHKESLTGLTDNTYHYYVKCKDIAGNKATADYDASFEVDIAPTAQISLSDPSPVKAGTITVTLTTSEDVKPTPSLKYSLDGSTDVNIPLSGSGSSWEGYMIIQSSDNDKIGSFEFSGIDLTGNTGTVITSGNLFLVDTIAPSTPTLLTAASKTNGNIKLSWYHDGEDVDYYNIYKSTAEGVDKLDFYITATTKSFIDTSTTIGTTYYYKVSAVDDAGNEGTLSDEVSIKSVKTTTTTATTQNPTTETATLSPELAKKVDNSTKIIDDLIIEIDEILLDFENSDKEEIQHLGIIEQINSEKNRLDNLKEELEELKLQNLSEAALDLKLKQINVKKEAVKKDIPKSISVTEEKDFEIDTTTEDVQTAIYELLKLKRMGKVEENKKQDFIQQNEELQELVEVKTSAKLIKIRYLDESEKDVTLVQKEISIEATELKDLMLVESIPKNVAENVNEIEFKNTDYTVIKKDPLVKWEYNKLENGLLNYVINKKVNLENIEDVKSVILFDPDILKEGYDKDTIKITGSATSKIRSFGSKIKDIVLIIMGILVIAGLLVYYFVFMGKEEKSKIISIKTVYKKPHKNFLNNLVANAADSISKITSYRKKDKSTVGLFDHHNYAEKEYSNIGLTTLKNIKLQVLLNKAHKHINNMEFDVANKIYFLVSQHCKTLKGKDQKEKEKIQDHLMRLYHKLSLYAKINEAHSYVGRDDHVNLRYVLNHITGFYNKLAEDVSEDEMELMSCAWEQHGIYSRKLINLRSLPYKKE